jgi:hypothetical protein
MSGKRQMQTIDKEELKPSYPAGEMDFPGDRPLPPKVIDDFDAGDASMGHENARAEDLATPFLYVLQQQSKACVRGGPQYVEGAQAGSLLNTSTRRVYDGERGIHMVAAYFRKVYIEWVPLDDGGGLVGTHEPEDPFIIDLRREQGQFTKLEVPGGSERYTPGKNTEIVETNEIYAIIGEPGFDIDHAERVIIPFTSIKQRAFKREWYTVWQNTLYKGGPVGIHWPRWLLTTAFETQWKPNGAWNLHIQYAQGNSEPVKSFMRKDDPVRKAAVDFANAVRSGEARADYSKAEQATDAEEMPL